MKSKKIAILLPLFPQGKKFQLPLVLGASFIISLLLVNSHVSAQVVDENTAPSDGLIISPTDPMPGIRVLSSIKLQEFTTTRNTYRELKNLSANVTDENREEVANKLFDNAKTMLLTQIDLIHDLLDDLARRVQSEESLGTAEKTTVIGVLNPLKDDFVFYRANISDVPSLEELELTYTKMLDETSVVLSAVKATSLMIHIIRSDSLISQAEFILGQIKIQVSAAGANGHDVKEVDRAYNRAQDSVDMALLAYSEARSYLSEASSYDLIPDEMFNTTHQKIKEANDYMKDALSEIKEAMSLLNVMYEQDPWEM